MQKRSAFQQSVFIFISLNNGLLERKFIWSPKEGLRLEFCSKRFVALKELHVIGQKVTVKVLEGKTVLGLKSGINGEGRYGEPHFIESQGFEENGIMQLAEKTHESEITFVVSSAIKAWMNNDQENNVKMAILPEEKKVMASCEVALEEGQEITFEKLSRVATTRDKDINIEERALLLAHEKEEMKKLYERGYEAVWTASEEAWKNLWTEKDVVITGEAWRPPLCDVIFWRQPGFRRGCRPWCPQSGAWDTRWRRDRRNRTCCSQ